MSDKSGGAAHATESPNSASAKAFTVNSYAEASALEGSPDSKPAQTGGRNGRWDMVPLSGIISGVVFAYSKNSLGSPAWIVVTGLAYVFCILSGNFHFSTAQKAAGTLIMLAIGMYWRAALHLIAH